jgi:hypothetical protein
LVLPESAYKAYSIIVTARCTSRRCT